MFDCENKMKVIVHNCYL